MKLHQGFAMLALVCGLSACNGTASAPAGATSAGKTAEPVVEGHGHDAASEASHTRIPAAIAAQSGINVQPAGPGTIADEHRVQGLLTPVDGRVAVVSARFPGPVRSLRARVGDRVRAGQTLATIHSNLSLSTYAVTAPISGVITARDAAIGGIADASTVLFKVADLSQLWVDLHVFGADAGHIRPGVPVTIIRMSDGQRARSTLERVLPGMATASQSTIARALIDNTDGLWRPGAAVKARITVARKPVGLRVPLSALQTMDGKDVVFVRAGDTYTARPVTLGMRDAAQVEVRAGLRVGEPVVVAESYLIKADILKQGAAHEH